MRDCFPRTGRQSPHLPRRHDHRGHQVGPPGGSLGLDCRVPLAPPRVRPHRQPLRSGRREPRGMRGGRRTRLRQRRVRLWPRGRGILQGGELPEPAGDRVEDRGSGGGRMGDHRQPRRRVLLQVGKHKRDSSSSFFFIEIKYPRKCSTVHMLRFSIHFS